jgi:purine-binding chemotaxis protein CheW
VEIDSESEIALIGIVVNSVSEVLNIKESEIEETPKFGTSLNTDYILGMAQTEGGVMILLDINCVLTSGEIKMIEKNNLRNV